MPYLRSYPVALMLYSGGADATLITIRMMREYVYKRYPEYWSHQLVTRWSYPEFWNESLPNIENSEPTLRLVYCTGNVYT